MPFASAVDRLYRKYGSSRNAANAIRAKAISDGIRTKAGSAAEFEKTISGQGGAIVSTHENWPIPPNVWGGVREFGLSDEWAISSFNAAVGPLGSLLSGFTLADVQVDADKIEAMFEAMPDREIELTEQMRRRLGSFAPSDPGTPPLPVASSPPPRVEVAITPLTAPEPEPKPRKVIALTPGPKSKFKTALYKIFKTHHHLLENMTEGAMFEHVKSHWIGDGPPKSARTVAKHWSDWRDDRLARVAKARAEMRN